MIFLRVEPFFTDCRNCSNFIFKSNEKYVIFDGLALFNLYKHDWTNF